MFQSDANWLSVLLRTGLGLIRLLVAWLAFFCWRAATLAQEAPRRWRLALRRPRRRRARRRASPPSHQPSN